MAKLKIISAPKIPEKPDCPMPGVLRITPGIMHPDTDNPIVWDYTGDPMNKKPEAAASGTPVTDPDSQKKTGK